MSRLFDILHLKFPAPQINSQKCSLEETVGEKRTDLPAHLKWQIGPLLCLKPPLGGVARRFTAPPQGGQRAPLSGSRGGSPGTPLVPFVVKRKEPRVWAG